MIAIVVPAHDEESLIAQCLHSLRVAAHCPQLRGEPVHVVVALDSCSDRTAQIAQRMGAHCIAVQACNVGVARAAGAQAALAAGARWLAFTDADSEVAPDWMAQQLAQNSDAVCGTVQVRDWQCHGSHVQAHFEATYQDRDGHRHIHGANLGVSARAYQGAGGFAPLSCSEDVALVHALQQHGARIAWSAAPRVTTSARRQYRAAGGFGATLEHVANHSHPTHPMHGERTCR
ncbi:MAG: glycosyltransferase [Comamonadaceae bacterium]|nr:MAG: glycosyltransferase [Comamonadaceae bacterium]